MSEQREFLHNVIGRITVHENALQMAVVQSALRAVLLGEQPVHSGKSTQGVFTTTIEARVKRCGWEVRLIVPSGTGTQMPTRPTLPLIKAVARVHRWPEKIMCGEFQSGHSIAQFARVDQRYAGRILQFAFLAPDEGPALKKTGDKTYRERGDDRFRHPRDSRSQACEQQTRQILAYSG